MKIMLYAIPVFFLLIGLELLFARLGKTRLYRLPDAVANINCGIVQQVGGVFLKTAVFGLYWWVFENVRLWDVPDTWWTWILLFVAVDCCYYWFHRYAHEISLLWGTHVVHHQSEEYNLSVALRQSLFQSVFSTFFYLPLALIGFSPAVFLVVSTWQTLYQFWIHTRLIGKLPAWFEWVFNTPSHHRVHHGINPQYIDKNHGGTLIVFDRLFGTFQEEEEAVVYGVTTPLNSWNPLWANVDYYVQFWRDWARMPGLGNKLRMWYHQPGWRPAELGGTPAFRAVSPETQVKYETEVGQGTHYYVLAQFIGLLVATSWWLESVGRGWGTGKEQAVQLSVALFIVAGTAGLGGLLERRSWAPLVEMLRLVGLALVLWWAY
jgi:sterol desaturase/sphingolipid hydroxylase (fatty acid hydroxylase superfamily)